MRVNPSALFGVLNYFLVFFFLKPHKMVTGPDAIRECPLCKSKPVSEALRESCKTSITSEQGAVTGCTDRKWC